MTDRELPQELKSVFKNMAAVALKWDFKRGSFYHSDLFERFYGSTMEPSALFQLASVNDLVHPDDVELVLKMWDQGSRTRETQTEILRVRMSDQTFHWVRVSVDQAYDEAGQPEFMMVTLLDIQSLVQEKCLLDNIVGTISSGICIYTLEGDSELMFVSPRALTILGLSREQAMGKREEIPHSQAHPEDLLKQALEILSDQQMGHFRYHACHPDGSHLWLDVNCAVTGYTRKQLYLTVLDITEKVREEETLRWEEERYRLLSEHCDAVTFDYDSEEDRFVYSVNMEKNGRSVKLIERFREAVFTCGLVHPEDLQRFVETVQGSLRGQNGELEARLDFYGGEYRYYKLTYICVVKKNGTVSRVVGRADDITEQHQKRMAVQEQQALFQKVLKENALISLTFDAQTRLRVLTEHDVVPEGFPPIRALTEFDPIFEQYLYPADYSRIPGFVSERGLAFSEYIFREAIEFECRFQSPGNNFEGYHWIKMVNILSCNEQNGHVLYLLRCMYIHEKKLEQLRLMESAERDALTGLYNISAFRSRCEQLLRQRTLQQERQMVGFALIKLMRQNQGRLLQDTSVSDKVLQRTGDTFRAMLQEGDVAARLGGALFALFLSHVEDEKLMREKLRILKGALSHQLPDGSCIAASIGASAGERTQQCFNSIYNQADQALFQARMQGGNQVAFYSAETEQKLQKTSFYTHEKEYTTTQKRQVYIRAFGYFDVFLNGSPIAFVSGKSKELLALLVDRRGGFVSSREAISYLWEDEAVDEKILSRYRKVAMRLKDILTEYGIADIMETRNGQRRIVPERVDCDFYDYLSGKQEYMNLFKGNYLLNYSWSELTLSDLKLNLY